MQVPSRRRSRDEGNDEEFDRQKDRKQRRRSERQARKKARIEAHEQWVEQRRSMKQNAYEEREEKQHDRKRAQLNRLPSTNASAALPRRVKAVARSTKITNNHSGAIGSLDDENTCSSSKTPASSKEHVPLYEEEQPSMMLAGATLSTRAADTSTIVISDSAMEPTLAKYTPPTLRRKLTEETITGLDERTRRIVNKLTVRNVVELTRETSDLFGGAVEGATRASVLHSLLQHINRMCMLDTGPLTPIVSLPLAGLIRGLQLLHGNVVGAELIEGLCLALQERLNDNSETSASNGAMVFAHLYLLNAVDSLLASSFLCSTLRIEGQRGVCAVACALTFLRACGEKLLKEAPGQMEQALTEARASYKSQEQSSVRHSTLLSYIADILTGHTRSAKRTVDEEKAPVESLLRDMATLLPGGGVSGSKRVFHRVMSTTSVLTGLTWAQMMRSDKPPRWFTAAAWESVDGDVSDNFKMLPRTSTEALSSTTSEGKSTDDEEDEAELKAERIRQLRQQEKAISGQRFNTENKREVFQVCANSSDDLEGFTLLMHRDPSFSRLHDTLAVLLQCAYQEKVYNPYYAQVIQRFCSAKESCKNTLQFALWDMFKAIRVESVDIIGYVNLSCLLTHLIEVGVFTLAVLRGLDLDGTNRTIGLFTRVLLLRLILQLPPVRLAEVFFGGDGFRAHDVKIDTRVLRSNLAEIVERYFVDERESGKWIPHFYDVVARGTSFDVQRQDRHKVGGNGERAVDDEAQLQLFIKRIHVVFKALKRGIS
ncbi:putative nucleolar MIF4G domain-containing protein 1-like [Trypanosoma rangeli]|uniref:Putative nucleolar MIF4G domain-containing protein 1-like n=1 Tax=Trypanosoma rangeli TaxID=5698 RepID=A0A422P4Z6_TRYRA|nr:putative nucleolar MIF4G domain-containing protein 1-like [Trypanosoma rangeli]RNF12778.1 putative nucleolar MIF4G domain-containing protein 1-like [Trypanosoma rangeli]|eukprot:RNF12778.1 putative nucleolar MIF4G domain-containing protein 1-like [Trypanosoma rangeli]